MESKRFAASIISLVAFIWFAILLKLIKCNVENCLDVVIDIDRITRHWFAVVPGKFFLFKMIRAMFRQDTRVKRTFKSDQPENHWTAERNEKEAAEFQRVCLSKHLEEQAEMARLANRTQKILFSPSRG